MTPLRTVRLSMSPRGRRFLDRAKRIAGPLPDEIAVDGGSVATGQNNFPVETSRPVANEAPERWGTPTDGAA